MGVTLKGVIILGTLIVALTQKLEWELQNPVTFVTSTGFWTVPAGFVTDFASVPRPLRWVAERDQFALPAVLHDWLWHLNLLGVGPDPAETDNLFHEALRACGAKPVTARLMWAAVRTASIASGRVGSWQPGRVTAFLAALIVATVVVLPAAAAVIASIVVLCVLDTTAETVARIMRRWL